MRNKRRSKYLFFGIKWYRIYGQKACDWLDMDYIPGAKHVQGIQEIHYEYELMIISMQKCPLDILPEILVSMLDTKHINMCAQLGESEYYSIKDYQRGKTRHVRIEHLLEIRRCLLENWAQHKPTSFW